MNVAKMWDKEAAIDLRAKAEDYLLEYKPGLITGKT